MAGGDILDLNVFESKKEFFKEGNTLSYEFRIEQLRKLINAVEKYEKDILNALRLDLNKSEYEAYTSEEGIVYKELKMVMKNLRNWMKVKKVKTPIFLQPGKSYIVPSPTSRKLQI